VIALTHFRDESPDFADRAERALSALAARPGYLRGSLARSTDDPGAWLLLTEWENVGSYRRALSGYEVKVHATPLLATALDLPGGFESLVDVAPGGGERRRESDLATGGTAP
jgi:heme oxygenase (mycobilin-producing)